MTWIASVLDLLLQKGRRKAIMSLGAVGFLTLGAKVLHASFAEYRDGVVAVLGIALAGHVVQQATQKVPH